jgi:hypothetical protein
MRHAAEGAPERIQQRTQDLKNEVVDVRDTQPTPVETSERPV